MERPSVVKPVGLVAVFLSCALSDGSGYAQERQLKEGWNPTTLGVAVEGCARSFVARAKKDFDKESKATGRTDRIFPATYAAEAKDLCQCVMNHIAASMTPAESRSNRQKSLSIMKQVIRDGTCKSHGRLGKEIAQFLEDKADKRALDPKSVDPDSVKADLETLCKQAQQLLARKKPLRCDQTLKTLSGIAKTDTLKTTLKIVSYADAEERHTLFEAGLVQAVPGVKICEALSALLKSCR